jgi:hypothetical protein
MTPNNNVPRTGHFDIAQECTRHFDHLVNLCGNAHRDGEEQTYCMMCRRWKYKDQRCNLFRKKERQLV